MTTLDAPSRWPSRQRHLDRPARTHSFLTLVNADASDVLDQSAQHPDKVSQNDDARSVYMDWVAAPLAFVAFLLSLSYTDWCQRRLSYAAKTLDKGVQPIRAKVGQMTKLEISDAFETTDRMRWIIVGIIGLILAILVYLVVWARGLV